jgi:hypothetical protein
MRPHEQLQIYKGKNIAGVSVALNVRKWGATPPWLPSSLLFWCKKASTMSGPYWQISEPRTTLA